MSSDLMSGYPSPLSSHPRRRSEALANRPATAAAGERCGHRGAHLSRRRWPTQVVYGIVTTVYGIVTCRIRW